LNQKENKVKVSETAEYITVKRNVKKTQNESFLIKNISVFKGKCMYIRKECKWHPALNQSEHFFYFAFAESLVSTN